jgi:DNA-binding transcriptional regulator LsrR (DeoR family)
MPSGNFAFALESERRTQQVVVWYTRDHLTVRQIGKLLDISGAAVHKRLKRAGISAAQGTMVTLTCATCETPNVRWRSRAKAAKVYCNSECYFAARENLQFKPWRNGGHLARAVVSKHFDLQREHVVHHEDSDQANNDLGNLRVFATQADHLKYHHAKRTGEYAPLPLWSGLAS